MLSTTCWQDQWSPLSQFSFHHFLVNTYLFKIISVSFILITLVVFWFSALVTIDYFKNDGFIDHQMTPVLLLHFWHVVTIIWHLRQGCTLCLIFWGVLKKKQLVDGGKRSFHPHFWALSVNKPPRQAHQVLGSVHK